VEIYSLARATDTPRSGQATQVGWIFESTPHCFISLHNKLRQLYQVTGNVV